MAGLTIKLEEQLSDLRSDQIAYKVTIQNTTSEPITILSVEPNVPVGAKVLEITDNSFAEYFSKKSELISELSTLLGHFLWVTSESFREKYIEAQHESLKKIFNFSGILKIYISLVFDRKSLASRLDQTDATYKFRISSVEDARTALKTWIDAPHQHFGIETLFKAKLQQLESVDSRLSESEQKGSSLTTIEPDSSFSATYVLKFKRGLLDPRKYQVSFSAKHKKNHPDSSPQSSSAATNVLISPSPVNLTIVAVISALLGILLRGSLGDEQNKFLEFANLAKTGQIFVGPVIALIFFNIYEHTSIGKGLNFSINWRSALFIGAMCGLAQDRVIAALKALLGF